MWTKPTSQDMAWNDAELTGSAFLERNFGLYVFIEKIPDNGRSTKKNYVVQTWKPCGGADGRLEMMTCLCHHMLYSSIIHHALITQSKMPQLTSYNLTQIATKFWSDPPHAVQHAINGFHICYRTHLKVPLVKNVTFQYSTPVLWNTPHVFTSELWIFTLLPQCSLHIHEIHVCQCTVSDCKNAYVEKQHCWWCTLYLHLAQLGRLAWQLNLTVTYPPKTNGYISIFYCL